MTANHQVSITVNGTLRNLAVTADTRLVDALRGPLGLTGTRTGCDTAQCGACTVHQDGRPVRACAQLALQADGTAIETIESVGRHQTLHVMQEAFRKHHALQCGYCTSGMVMTALALAYDKGTLDDRTVRKALKGNICRCTGYQTIVAAILEGAAALRAEAPV